MKSISSALGLFSERLEAEILLAHVLNVPRSYLYAYPEKKLTKEQEALFDSLITRRVTGEPLPYLTGHQAFWSLDFIVTKDTLIPRPETELLVETLLELFSADKKIIADLGTGSGAIALSLAHERPSWEIHATDQSSAALTIAKQNAEKLNIKNCLFHLGHWCDALPKIQFDAIVSNPPYIAENDIHLIQGGLPFEPRSALVSGKEGLDAIAEIIVEAKQVLKPGGILLFEHGYQQAAIVRELLKVAGYRNTSSKCDLSGIERVTVGFLG